MTQHSNFHLIRRFINGFFLIPLFVIDSLNIGAHSVFNGLEIYSHTLQPTEVLGWKLCEIKRRTLVPIGVLKSSLTTSLGKNKKKKKSKLISMSIHLYFIPPPSSEKENGEFTAAVASRCCTSKDLQHLACLCGANNKSLAYNTCRGRHPKTPVNLYRQPNSIESLSAFIDAICRHRFQSGRRCMAQRFALQLVLRRLYDVSELPDSEFTIDTQCTWKVNSHPCHE